MAQEFAKEFYKSRQWLKCRGAYIAYRKSVDGGICEICHDKPGYIVHHVTELTPSNIHDPDITLSFDNLQFVCLDCHNDIHNGYKNLADDLVRCEFAPDGELIARPPQIDRQF